MYVLDVLLLVGVVCALVGEVGELALVDEGVFDKEVVSVWGELDFLEGAILLGADQKVDVDVRVLLVSGLGEDVPSTKRLDDVVVGLLVVGVDLELWRRSCLFMELSQVFGGMGDGLVWYAGGVFGVDVELDDALENGVVAFAFGHLFEQKHGCGIDVSAS